MNYARSRDRSQPAQVESALAERMRDDDVDQLESLQAMAMTFATWLHDKGAEQIAQGGERAVERVGALSNSFNKAARAVRQIVVLKHEVAGLRPTPNARAAGPANQNTANGAGPIRPRHGHDALFGNAARSGNSDRERRDYDDLTDKEQDDLLEKGEVYLRKLIEALEIDIQAAGPEKIAEAHGQSVAVKLSVIAASIPHPTLDRVLADIEMDKLWDSFAPKYAKKPTGADPPR